MVESSPGTCVSWSSLAMCYLCVTDNRHVTCVQARVCAHVCFLSAFQILFVGTDRLLVISLKTSRIMTELEKQFYLSAVLSS